MSINRVDKEDVVHIYNGVLLSHKKEQNGHEEPRGKMGINTHLLENGLEGTGMGKCKLGQSKRVVVYIWTYIYYQM